MRFTVTYASGYHLSVHNSLTIRSLGRACLALAEQHSIFDSVYTAYGTPPLWDREPGFATLLHIILEQQVSLASAKACFDKLCGRVEAVTPKTVLSLDDTELRVVGFSRQKAAYARNLAEAVLSGGLDLESLVEKPDAEVKSELIKLKGIGEWTSDIYLLMALLRPDIMPRGDIALHAAWQKLTGNPRPSSDQFVELAAEWAPHRSTAARLLWHYYLSERANARQNSR